jgi:TBC1 domain family member 24
MASLVAAKEKVFITQTKLLFEVTWKTVMQIAKKHAVSERLFPFHFSDSFEPEAVELNHPNAIFRIFVSNDDAA